MKKAFATIILVLITISTVFCATYKIKQSSTRTLLDTGKWSEWSVRPNTVSTIEINAEGEYIEVISDDSYIFQIMSKNTTKESGSITEKTYICSDNEAEDCIIRHTYNHKSGANTIIVEYPSTQYQYAY